MLALLLIVTIVSAALVLGAVWGAKGSLSPTLEGALVGISGGALIVALVVDLIEPASRSASLVAVMAAVAAGAVVFTVVDWIVDEKWGEDSGGGLLAAIVLDGVPEQLALGVVLIGAGPLEVASFATALVMSNLPEAAGGAKRMVEDGLSETKAIGLWSGTAALLALCTVAGYYLIDPYADGTTAIIQAVAAGAVIAALSTEILPKAFDRNTQMVGIYVAIGVMVAFSLHAMVS